MIKGKVKAFTLVEMLIVVVIIGILASALIPRLTWAQARARDAARQWNLTQLATALNVYFSDNWSYPDGWLCVSDLRDDLIPNYIKTIPTDPQRQRITYGTKPGGCTSWDYAYAWLTRNGAARAGMVVIANTESPGKKSNWVLRNSDFINTVSFSWAADSSTMDEDISDDDYIFKNAERAEEHICKAVTLDAGASSNSLAHCIAKQNPAMVYVVFQ